MDLWKKFENREVFTDEIVFSLMIFGSRKYD